MNLRTYAKWILPAVLLPLVNTRCRGEETGKAAAAKLNFPWGVSVDNAGNLYFADSNNHRIRKVVSSTGIINTVAGTGEAGYSGDGAAAHSAQLNTPYGVALDSAGNLYFADARNDRSRKVTASTGILTTVAGTGTVGDSGDGGVANTAELDIPPACRWTVQATSTSRTAATIASARWPQARASSPLWLAPAQRVTSVTEEQQPALNSILPSA